MSTKFFITEINADGKSRNVVELTEKEYTEMMRSMQWPEDLPAFDKLNKPVNFAEVGAPL